MDPTSLPPPRLANLVYYWAKERLSEEGWRRFEMELNMPPPEADPDDVDPEGPWSAEAEMAQFRAVAAS